MQVSDLQTRLAAMGFFPGQIDNLYGPKTDDAVTHLLLRENINGSEDWPDARQKLAAMQIIARYDGIDVGTIDGRIGPQTRQALAIWDARKKNGGLPDPKVENWRDDEKAPKAEPTHEIPAPPTGSQIDIPTKPPQAWPTESRVPQFFGGVGTSQVTLHFPFPMRLAWDMDQRVNTASCHIKCRESFERIWSNTLAHYGIDEIRRLRLDLYGGLLNIRKKRGSATAWSMHSWGIAQDVDPDHNQLNWGADKASLDNKPYDAFWGFVYAEGFISLGRERNFDFMHMQAAKL